VNILTGFRILIDYHQIMFAVHKQFNNLLAYCPRNRNDNIYIQEINMPQVLIISPEGIIFPSITSGDTALRGILNLNTSLFITFTSTLTLNTLMPPMIIINRKSCLAKNPNEGLPMSSVEKPVVVRIAVV